MRKTLFLTLILFSSALAGCIEDETEIWTEDEDPRCIGFDDRLDSDGDGTPNCAEDEF